MTLHFCCMLICESFYLHFKYSMNRPSPYIFSPVVNVINLFLFPGCSAYTVGTFILQCFPSANCDGKSCFVRSFLSLPPVITIGLRHSRLQWRRVLLTRFFNFPRKQTLSIKSTLRNVQLA